MLLSKTSKLPSNMHKAYDLHQNTYANIYTHICTFIYSTSSDWVPAIHSHVAYFSKRCKHI